MKKSVNTTEAGQMPTATEIATIAAALARNGSPAHPYSAIMLWHDCNDYLNARGAGVKYYRDERQKEKSYSYPMPLEMFLQVLIPQQKAAKRKETFRRYLEESEDRAFVFSMFDCDTTDGVMAFMQANGIADVKTFQEASLGFERWNKQHVSEERSKAGKYGAAIKESTKKKNKKKLKNTA